MWQVRAACTDHSTTPDPLSESCHKHDLNYDLGVNDLDQTKHFKHTSTNAMCDKRMPRAMSGCPSESLGSEQCIRLGTVPFGLQQQTKLCPQQFAAK
jgi:hypothetical protein